MRIIVLLLTLLAMQSIKSVQAADFAGSGELLRMIQKIQGTWRSGCQSAHDSQFQSIRLRFTYTHFIVESRVFEDNSCMRLTSTTESIYRYSVGNKLALPNGDVAYELDLAVKESAPHVKTWYPANLVSYRDGGLLFASRPVTGSGRAQRLDATRPFVR